MEGRGGQPERPSARRRRAAQERLHAHPDGFVSRADAAALLGVSLDTVDRRVRGLVSQGSLGWGGIGRRAGDLAALLDEPWPGRGRPRRLDASLVARIAREHDAGASLAAIARRLNAEGVPTAQGGRAWYASTV